MLRTDNDSDDANEVQCTHCGQDIERDHAHDTHEKQGERWWCPNHCPHCVEHPLSDSSNQVQLDNSSPAVIDFTLADWVQYGLDKGWCSEAACATHDGVPCTDEEVEEWHNDEPPCEFVLRLWLHSFDHSGMD
jgi:hypothetical protein